MLVPLNNGSDGGHHSSIETVEESRIKCDLSSTAVKSGVGATVKISMPAATL